MSETSVVCQPNAPPSGIARRDLQWPQAATIMIDGAVSHVAASSLQNLQTKDAFCLARIGEPTEGWAEPATPAGHISFVVIISKGVVVTHDREAVVQVR
jgi:hypothetical protein